MVETPRASLVSGRKWLLGTSTMRFNDPPGQIHRLDTRVLTVSNASASDY